MSSLHFSVHCANDVSTQSEDVSSYAELRIYRLDGTKTDRQIGNIKMLKVH